MADDIATPAAIHRHKIRERWDTLLDTYGELLVDEMEGQLEFDTVNSLVAQISVLWLAISTQTTDRTEFKAHALQYKRFEPYVKEPRRFIDDPQKLFDLLDIMSKLMEDLKITRE